MRTPGLEVIKLEYSLKLKIKCNDWLLADTKCATKIALVSLPINLNMCFGCSKEPSHGEGSFEFPQHMFWLRNKKTIFQYVLLS